MYTAVWLQERMLTKNLATVDNKNRQIFYIYKDIKCGVAAGADAGQGPGDG